MLGFNEDIQFELRTEASVSSTVSRTDLLDLVSTPLWANDSHKRTPHPDSVSGRGVSILFYSEEVF